MAEVVILVSNIIRLIHSIKFLVETVEGKKIIRTLLSDNNNNNNNN